ncbi:dual-specificity protein phosphatase, putative [Trypanosoma brucei gambiense DAL972]|uniref:protein-tyrosine-phosphatase n=1 Tax=Trypanosoma brucei gambiense (strain MHOM/CI/86/DAL972) TaxID=679716 RepID=C9ZPN7_TRYB9|nr:dual-specificity protein phosphatase, putative [Trypanosoma brucei gambiense DAL972]CBH11365.1 dual-specificity protein phosphatase, putative [Trypanosoma brucei gambiense DAL972]|eukprot:XP_011773652.1 dual-specificity protein phosphatase, putative [Trypanosoma brucei gambiense DAL972]
MQSSSFAGTGVFPPPPAFLRGNNSIRTGKRVGRLHHHFTDENVVDLRSIETGVECSTRMGHSRSNTAAEDPPLRARRRIPHGSNPPTKILDFLFLGGVSDATNPEFLRRENIVTILNVSREEYWSVDKGITIHPFPLEDNAEENIRKFFSHTYRLLEAARSAYYSSKKQCERSTSTNDAATNSNLDYHNGNENGSGCSAGTNVVNGYCEGSNGGTSSNINNSMNEATDNCAISASPARPPCVLVHCRYGISRSVTIVLAYLMRRNGWSLNDALQYVMCRRPHVEPNVGFMNVLLSFQRDMDPQKRDIQRNLLPIVVRNLPPNTSSSAVHKFFEDRVGCVHKVATFPSRVAAGNSTRENTDGNSKDISDESSTSDCNDEISSGAMWLVVFATPDSVHLAHRLYHKQPDFFAPLGVSEGRRVKLTALSKLHRSPRPITGGESLANES